MVAEIWASVISPFVDQLVALKLVFSSLSFFTPKRLKCRCASIVGVTIYLPLLFSSDYQVLNPNHT